MVLFKYSSISSTLIMFTIYIPLWSYSNEGVKLHTNREHQFTFHYGPIQMMTVVRGGGAPKRFTFHYGPIQISYIAL